MQTPPIETIHLFAELDQHLIALLQSLKREDWMLPTIAGSWTIKDVAAHLLDGNLRGISFSRDAYFGESPENPESHQDLVQFLNGLNADWVQAMQRISPEVLVFLLEISNRLYREHLETLHPFGEAVFSVGWAGEDQSENWFHIAREYMEKWHHQQQIRLALNQQQPLFLKHLYYPFLDTAMRALPFRYQNVDGKVGDLVQIKILGAGGGNWYLTRGENAWSLRNTINSTAPNCEITIPEDIAWRVFTKGLKKEEAENLIDIRGNRTLGKPIFNTLAIMG